MQRFSLLIEFILMSGVFIILGLISLAFSWAAPRFSEDVFDQLQFLSDQMGN